MKTLLQVIGEGLVRYVMFFVGNLSKGTLYLIGLAFRLMLGATLVFGVLCLVLAPFLHQGSIWRAAYVLMGWNLFLFIGLYIFNQARAGRFNPPSPEPAGSVMPDMARWETPNR